MSNPSILCDLQVILLRVRLITLVIMQMSLSNTEFCDVVSRFAVLWIVATVYTRRSLNIGQVS
jgi:hypothetical protein